jgi:hypothetical protein
MNIILLNNIIYELVDEVGCFVSKKVRFGILYEKRVNIQICINLTHFIKN